MLWTTCLRSTSSSWGDDGGLSPCDWREKISSSTCDVRIGRLPTTATTRSTTNVVSRSGAGGPAGAGVAARAGPGTLAGALTAVLSWVVLSAPAFAAGAPTSSI